MSKETFSFQTLTEEDYKQVNHELSKGDTLDVLKWGFSQFGDKLVYACSFGAEAMVLIDLIYKVRKNAKIIFLDTNKHFAETYTLIQEVKKRYPELQIDIRQPALSLEEQASQYGDELWKSSPDICCNIRKIQPLQEALLGSAAWLSGLRRDQSPTRANTEFINPDVKFASIKICPLIHWTWDDVWNYIKAFQLPYNPLHDQGYPSIGCETCTLPVEEGGDSRLGRWANLGKTECGLHT